MLLITSSIYAQNVLVTDDNAFTSSSTAMLDVKSVTKGFLIPRLTSTQRDAISGTKETSLLIYNSTLSRYEYYNGTTWVPLNQMSGTFTQGSVPFAGADGLLTQNNSKLFWDNTNYRLGIGTSSPTATLHLQAGSASAGTAPLKFTAGPLLTTVEPGAMEYKGHTLYFTTYLIRRSVMLAQDVVMADVPVTNTSAETVIYTANMAADYLTAGKLINIKLYGNYRTKNNDGTNIFTIKVKEGSNTIITTTSIATNTGTGLRPWDIEISLTIRSIGTAGSVVSYGKIQQDNVADNADYSITPFNTTIANSVTVTITWSAADVNNQFNLLGGATECVDANN